MRKLQNSGAYKIMYKIMFHEECLSRFFLRKTIDTNYQ